MSPVAIYFAYSVMAGKRSTYTGCNKKYFTLHVIMDYNYVEIQNNMGDNMANEFDYAKLVKTKLWKCYEGRSVDYDRRKWIKDVYYNAIEQLTAVRDTFSNYTLHDETHVINVMEAIAGLLGDQIENLTEGEVELLILVACLHDIGMVYTQKDKEKWLNRTSKCDEFIRKNNPDLMGVRSEDWDENTKQNYFRWLHPFRVSEVLNQEKWIRLFNNRPKRIVSKQTIIAVCQAHGEELTDIDLTVSKARDVDVLFCAMMLRIGDLLDFDDSRAPQILFSYAEMNMKSQEEWDKHKASVGFNYPVSPSTNSLPYAAECSAPSIEHSIRSFLDWVDDELSNYRKMQNRFHERWNDFPLPYEVDRKEIECIGYESGDFKLTMDQEQILNLLMGENLYDSNDVFVRELLQNSIDATLLRSKLDPDFQAESEEARIDLWEWCDADGSMWFRIDDRGTGMTKGMIQRYFLKVGNSYYNSDELKRDIRDHGQEDYHAISRFGIGFLSCFLCGTSAEVSTLYFDSEKNRRANGSRSATYGYGIRMNITGLSGYYVMQNQASGHSPSQPLPSPERCRATVSEELEMDNYRHKPGTSIVIRIDPGKLGDINLREAVQKYLCCPRMPIYYNGERLGETYREFMVKFRNSVIRHTYEIFDEDKEKYEDVLQGHYPQLAVTAIPFDLSKEHIMDGMSGCIIKYDLLCDINFFIKNNFNILLERSGNYIGIILDKSASSSVRSYEVMKMNLKIDDEIYNVINFILSKSLFNGYYNDNIWACAYHGIFVGLLNGAKLYSFTRENGGVALVFLEGAQQPKVDVGRTKISALQLSSLLAISAKLYQFNINLSLNVNMRLDHSLAEWRKLRKTPLGIWLLGVLDCNISKSTEDLVLLHTTEYSLSISGKEYLIDLKKTEVEVDNEMILKKFILAYFQDTYEMTIDYIQGQVITLSEKSEIITAYDLFPPMMFCKAIDDNSRRYLCCRNACDRRCITVDHPYAIWLLNNASTLNHYFNQQFKRIVYSLCDANANTIIENLNKIRSQICSLSEGYGIDMSLCPELTEDDFWEKLN